MKEKSLLFLTKTPDLWRHSSKFGNSEVRKSFVIGCSPIRAFQPSPKNPSLYVNEIGKNTIIPLSELKIVKLR